MKDINFSLVKFWSLHSCHISQHYSSSCYRVRIIVQLLVVSMTIHSGAVSWSTSNRQLCHGQHYFYRCYIVKKIYKAARDQHHSCSYSYLAIRLWQTLNTVGDKPHNTANPISNNSIMGQTQWATIPTTKPNKRWQNP